MGFEPTVRKHKKAEFHSDGLKERRARAKEYCYRFCNVIALAIAN